MHLTPGSGLGFGNYLYLWLHAFVRQSAGADYRVLTPPGMLPWLDDLPLLRDALTVRNGDVRFADRRERWRFDLRAGFGTDFTREQLHRFIRVMMMDSPLLSRDSTSSDEVAVNVRRGDYYSKAHFRGTYSFDIVEYLDVALDVTIQRSGPIKTVRVVSDDVNWCRVKLERLLTAYAAEVVYVAPDWSPQEHFRRVATSRRIIGTNSTFSYWAGYVSNVLYPGVSHVTMPIFHARLGGNYRAYQLDPDWCIVEDIPGGWDG